MKIWVFSICRNEAQILPFFLRHYGVFSDRIIVWDDWSTDGTRDLLSDHPKVTMHDWPYDDGLDDTMFIQHAVNTYKMARGQADWAMWVDMDEFIWGADIPKILSKAAKDGYEVVATEGWNMVGEGLPKDDGRQLWQILPGGVASPIYAKPVVFQPSADISWSLGKHGLENCSPKVSPTPLLKLLHYRYLGRDYTKMRNARNYERCCVKTGSKLCAWSCDPNWTGQHSPDWAEEVKAKGSNALA